MKRPSHSATRGFTLIEILVVIAMITILAGFLLVGLQSVKSKQANAKARVQIQLLCKAIEDYKLDNGAYPNVTSGNGTNDLYKALFYTGYTNSQSSGSGNQTIYCADLNPLQKKQGWIKDTGASATSFNANAIIIDPWSNEYIYRTATTTSATGATTQNFSWNPDFDIWSKGKDGQTNATSPVRLNAAVNNDDIGNF